MANSTLVSLAILKVNFDLGKTYLDNFVPIVAECIRISEDDIVSLPVLQENLRSNFGLKIPQKVIEAILKRVKKGGFVYLEDRVYKKIMTY